VGCQELGSSLEKDEKKQTPEKTHVAKEEEAQRSWNEARNPGMER